VGVICRYRIASTLQNEISNVKNCILWSKKGNTMLCVRGKHRKKKYWFGEERMKRMRET
jgi:hypothetical protein